MAKRRNAKKEKAERNKINARNFRKKPSRYSKRTRRYFNNNNRDNGEQQTSENESKLSSTSN